ncbi:MAG: PilZ domain-containing protein [Oligoflexia bacterium]|nr:PilZ domain-containing protein [Oligoflexia bacterium]
MSQTAEKTSRRGSPRYRLRHEDVKVIRFVSRRAGRISTTYMYDISESGVAFLTSLKLAPQVGEVIKMDFSPMGSMQIACLGKVIRIEEPSKGTNWARFPDTVKVGVAFFKLPKPYRRILNNALGHAFYNERLRYQREQARNQWKNGWIYRHGQSIIATLVLLVALGTGAYLLWSNFDSTNFSLPEREPTFAEGFFDKVIKTNPKQKRDK